MGDEMDQLLVFLKSFWFRKLWQVGIVVCAGAASYAGVSMALVQGRIDNVEMGLSNISGIQAERARDGENFQSQITTEVRAVDANVDTLGEKFAAIQIDLATVKGILQEMQRRDVAARFVPN